MQHRCDDKLFTAKLADMVRLSERNGTYSFSNFFDERQCSEAQLWCSRNTGGLLYTLWGGFPEAKRKMLSVYPDYCQDYVQDDFPLRCITFTYRKEDTLTHRDFLGTFMGMQFRREVIGDIVTGEGITQAFVTDTAARMICSTIGKISHTGVKVSDDKPFELEIKQEFRVISGTVASMRLDCIVSLAANLSREKAAALIRSEKVEINHFTSSSISQELHEGDVLSIRGSGRFVLSNINGSTRKGRIHINLHKFI